jgi:CBS domain-containing protein
MTTTPLRLNAPPDATDREPTVEQVMTSAVVAVTADADLYIASRIMAARSVRHLPVMDGGRCLGLLLEIDVLQALALADNPIIQPPVLAGELCRTVPVSRPGDGRSIAARHMQDSGIDAVLVRRDDKVIGILTATDLIRSLAEDGSSGAAGD